MVVSHDEQAAGLADRVVHVRDGRISGEAARGEQARLVVGRGGWVRLPADARRAAGIGGHAIWQQREREIGLAGDLATVEPGPPAPGPSPAAGELAAELRDVYKSYGVGGRTRAVLSGFDATLSRGLLVALEGRSGSGKTTVLHLLAGLERPDAGSITVAGRELTTLDREEARRAPPGRPHLAWVGQEPGLIPFATALENATLALEIRDGGRRPGHEPLARTWLERLGLGDCIDRAADRLLSPVSASASRSRARSLAAPTCCCSTSRPLASRW